MSRLAQYAAFGRNDSAESAWLEPVGFEQLRKFDADDHLAAFRAFLISARAMSEAVAPTRPAQAAEPMFQEVCNLAVNVGAISKPSDAREFFLSHFQPCRIRIGHDESFRANGFLTGYYEPEVEGSLAQTSQFTAPVLARPNDLVTMPQGETRPGLGTTQSAARITPSGDFVAYPDREAIEGGAIASHTRAIVWLHDHVEVFLVQVQGSARIRLPDNRKLRLGYAGRNGHPYTSIGRILMEQDEILEPAMSLAKLKRWIREAGQEQGQRGRKLMQRNRSYVFFKFDDSLQAHQGPIGASGVSLTELRSIAVDRSLWHYGLPYWVDADLPWRGRGKEPFRRLMIGQDTGSAIVGPARADIFFGTGDMAGTRAGDIRHSGDIHVLIPTCGKP